MERRCVFATCRRLPSPPDTLARDPYRSQPAIRASAPTVARVPSAIAAAAIWAACCAPLGAAERVEDFEGPNTSWVSAGADLKVRLESHFRSAEAPHTGRQSEQIVISGAGGSFCYFSHPLPRSRIFAELAVTAWIKSNRPDLQLLVRVVLPHSPDPQTGKPLTALVRGDSYQKVGAWAQLRVHQFPLLVERQVRVLRARHGPQVDAREAYIDLAVLNVYGGPGRTEVQIDDLEIAGAVAPPATRDVRLTTAEEESSTLEKSPPAREVRLDGSILTVDGRPIFPRIIEHRGESLEALADLGFNAVRLSAPPTPRLLAEAEQAGLWIVCPPPEDAVAPAPPDPAGTKPARSRPAIPAGYDRVLAWTLGDGLTSRDLERIESQSRLLRQADQRRNRPLLVSAENDLRQFSRHANLLGAYRFPLSTSLELVDYATWLRSRGQLAVPGTPLWTVIQTQPAAALRRQWNADRPADALQGSIDPDALRLLAFTAVAVGVRGLEFASHSSLESTDSDTHRRARSLRLLNLELQLLEPWGAAGNFVTAADSNDPQVKAVLLQYDRALLMIVTRVAQGSQFVADHGANRPVSFVAPGIPESHDLMELTPAGLRPLKQKRVAGGALVTLEEFDTTALVLATPDPLIVQSLSRKAASVARVAAGIERELAADTLAQVEAAVRALPAQIVEAQASAAPLAKARASLEECDQSLATGNRREAYAAGRRARAQLGSVKRTLWQRSVKTLGSSVASPYLGSFETLPGHFQLLEGLRQGRILGNRLPAGDFEHLLATQEAGWKHFQFAQPGIRTEVELIPGGGSAGKSCLRLAATPEDPRKAPAVVESAPVWIQSPSVAAQPGKWFCIRGRVRIEQPITGSVDGLMIIDSFGGEPLAERFGKTNGWQDFVLYRVAPHEEPLSLTFVVTGYGEALIDEITVQPVEIPPQTRIDQTRRMQQWFERPRR